MSAEEVTQIREQAKATYHSSYVMWANHLPWSWQVYKRLSEIVSKWKQCKNQGKILNIGAGRNTYGLDPYRTFNIDQNLAMLEGLQNAVSCSADALPFKSNSFDMVLCVGSIVAYCPLTEVLREVNRLLVPGGKFLLHYESSWSLEFLGTPTFKATVAVADTFNDGDKEKAWVYSPEFVEFQLESMGFKVLKQEVIHLLSPLIYRITKSEPFAAKFARFDRVLARFVPNGFAENQILFIEKL
ncbi:class I SAM-dependent methyltransferase [Thalassospira xiamenensis]|uniref:class I SAM-dependent methyltransferase n=1 Tax=Thalassospira xiamenensis TaxID=220697 RepID=UPI003AA8D930